MLGVVWFPLPFNSLGWRWVRRMLWGDVLWPQPVDLLFFPVHPVLAAATSWSYLSNIPSETYTKTMFYSLVWAKWCAEISVMSLVLKRYLLFTGWRKTLLFIKKKRCSKTGIGKMMGIFLVLRYFVNYKWVSLNQEASFYIHIGCSLLNIWNTESEIVAIFVLIHTASVRLNDLWLLKKEFLSYGSSTNCTKIEGSIKQSLKTKQGFVVKKNI